MPSFPMIGAQGDLCQAFSNSLLPSGPAFEVSHCHRAPGNHRESQLLVIGRKLLQSGCCSTTAGPAEGGPTRLIKSASRARARRFSGSACSPAVEPGRSRRPSSSSTFSSGSPSCATGLSTEHSSIYSWRYDEFDRVNTQRVRQLFCAVDELLYEGKVSGRSQGLQEECQAWNGHSPHLRILGNQLEPPKQEGFQYIHTQTPSSTRGTVIYPCLDRREDHSQLCVEGHGLVPGPPSTPGSRPCLSDHLLCSAQEGDEEEEEEEEEEVVYEAEGRLEEFLAYDMKEMEDEGADQRKQRKACYHAVALEGGGGGGGGGGVPPVSPHACIKDAVAGDVFDDAWRLATRALHGLLRKHWEMELAGEQRGGGGGGGGEMVSDVAESCDRGQSEQTTQVNTKCCRQFSSRVSNAKMLLPSIFNGTQDSSVFRINLNGVMTIQAKPLQQRAQGLSEKSLCDADERSSMATCGRSQAQRSLCALSHRAPGQRRLLPRLSGSRARPLPSSHLLYSKQVLHGTKLCTVSEGLPSPPVSATLSHRPLHLTSDVPEKEPTLTRTPRHAQPRWRLLRGGMSSAVHPRSSLPPLREPTLSLEPVARPSTTHTIWSDTPMKNSFSPVDFACSLMKPATRAALSGSRRGVTGFSLGMTSSMASGFSESATPPRRRKAYMPSSAEGEGGNGALIMGVSCQRKALGRFPGNGRRKFQVVMP